jgi:hypothetical protein
MLTDRVGDCRALVRVPDKGASLGSADRLPRADEAGLPASAMIHACSSRPSARRGPGATGHRRRRRWPRSRCPSGWRRRGDTSEHGMGPARWCHSNRTQRPDTIQRFNELSPNLSDGPVCMTVNGSPADHQVGAHMLLVSAGTECTKCARGRRHRLSYPSSAAARAAASLGPASALTCRAELLDPAGLGVRPRRRTKYPGTCRDPARNGHRLAVEFALPQSCPG